jgi:hypothetical protein
LLGLLVDTAEKADFGEIRNRLIFIWKIELWYDIMSLSEYFFQEVNRYEYYLF